MPRVTVVIPNYNHANYLASRVDSVLAQTYQDFDVLLLDDASTDGSSAVIAKYADHTKVRVISNVVNSGSTFRQWNLGVSEAAGDLVWIAESDDWAEPRLLETLVSALDASPSVGLAYCGSWKVASDGNRIGCATDDLPGDNRVRWFNDFQADGRGEIRNSLMYFNPILNASAVVFRKSHYVAIGGADEQYRLLGDWKVWIDMLTVSDVSFTAERLNHFRFHQGNVRTLVAPTRFLTEVFHIFQHVVEVSNLLPAELDRYCQRNFDYFLRADLMATYPTILRQQVLRLARRIDPDLRHRYDRDKFRTAARIVKKWFQWQFQKLKPKSNLQI